LALEVLDGPLPPLVLGPLVGPHVELLKIDGLDAEILEARLGRPPDMVGGERLVEAVFWPGGPLAVLRWDLGRDDDLVTGMAFEHVGQDAFTAAVAVGESRVEERASELDRVVECRHRLVIVRARPASHAPEAVTHFGNLPAQPAEPARLQDRKSTPLNSSHVKISYAV